MRSSNQHSFARLPSVSIKRSTFDRSHTYKTTLNAGDLIPFFVEEILPGDTCNLNFHGFARLATPIFPIMDNMYFDTHYFFVPNRLVWDNWKKFMGEQERLGASIDYMIPQIQADGATGHAPETIYDYMGLPTLVPNLEHSALPLRAYNLIWNEWFRSQDLQDIYPQNHGDGPDNPTDYKLLKRNKRHDYFTSCLPKPQKGDSIRLPLSGNAPLVNRINTGLSLELSAKATDGSNLGGQWIATAGGQMQHTATLTANSAVLNIPGLEADLSLVDGTTINDLRESLAIQRFLETQARHGSRYIEMLKSIFGVDCPDYRLQRPEFLGGGTTPVNINPVAQTSSTDATTPQGHLSAFGTASLSGGHGFTKSFTEHGYIIGMISVRADLNYQQGLNRMWSRKTRFDFPLPDFAHLGEQAVLNEEIYAQGLPVDQNVFGYQERYAECRYKPGMITGQFRSNFPQTLDSWHLTQNFANLPILGDQFLQEQPPIDRIKALVDEYPDFILDGFFSLKHTRPLPVHGIPCLGVRL